jgi:hypothetical protein
LIEHNPLVPRHLYLGLTGYKIMSMNLMVLAMKAKVGNPLRKLVLIKLADNASDTGECWPSYQHIADQCEISKRSAMAHIKQLAAFGFLKIEHREGKHHKNSSNLYHLTISAGDSLVQEIHQGGAGDSLGGSAGDSPRISNSLEPVNETVISIVHKRICKSDLWKEFYQNYPETRRGGTDATAWNKAKAMKLTDNDFQLMLDDVVNRKAFHSGWANPQYIQGITKYISEKLWLTPIEQASQSTDFSGQQSVSNWADGLANEFHGVNK